MKNYKFFKGIYPTGVLTGETLSETNNNKGGGLTRCYAEIQNPTPHVIDPRRSAAFYQVYQ